MIAGNKRNFINIYLRSVNPTGTESGEDGPWRRKNPQIVCESVSPETIKNTECGKKVAIGPSQYLANTGKRSYKDIDGFFPEGPMARM